MYSNRSYIASLLVVGCAVLFGMEGSGMKLGKIGRRGLMTYWRNPYVTDGLVAYWDGEWNAGGGVHDESITNWYDLTGNGHKLHAPSPIWVSDGVVYSAVNNIFRASADEGEWFRSLLGTGRYSVEVVASGFPTLFCAFLCYRTKSDFYLGGTGTNSAVTGVLFKSLGNADKYSPFVNHHMSLPRFVHLGCDLTAGALIMNHTKVDITGNFAITPVKFQMALGATGELGDPKVGQKYHRLAIYSRPLTTDEVAANYAVDKARFNLP